jgi:hypothetical protein
MEILNPFNSYIPINCLCTKFNSKVRIINFEWEIENQMAKKYMVVVMELIIMIMVFELVQANDLINLSFLSTSSLPNYLLHHPQLDVMDRRGVLEKCLRKEVRKCKRENEIGSFEFKKHFIYSFFQCCYIYKVEYSQVNVKDRDIIFHARVKECVDLCFPTSREFDIHNYGTCLFKCYEKHIKRN